MEGRNKKDEKQKKKRNYKYLRANGEKRKNKGERGYRSNSIKRKMSI